MNNQVYEAARKLMRVDFDKLSEREQRVLRHITEGVHISRPTNQEFDAQLTFGQRIADQVAVFGGSWTFILLFGAVLLSWIFLNTFVLARADTFDPYPYILLNLVLSMVAALQAPVIMMSQNRQATKDRLDAAHDFEVNLKAELEIRALHEKLDMLREKQWLELVAMQQEQIRLLTQLLNDRSKPG